MQGKKLLIFHLPVFLVGAVCISWEKQTLPKINKSGKNKAMVHFKIETMFQIPAVSPLYLVNVYT